MRLLDGITDSMEMSLGNLWEFGDGQGGLACCSPWGHKESDATELLQWTSLIASSVVDLLKTGVKSYRVRIIYSPTPIAGHLCFF